MNAKIYVFISLISLTAASESAFGQFDLNSLLKNIQPPPSANTNQKITTPREVGGGTSMAGFVCSDFKKPNSKILYSGSVVDNAFSITAADFGLSIEETKRLLMYSFITEKTASWVKHKDANFQESLLNKDIKATLVEFKNKPEKRLEMATRLRQAANDAAHSASKRAEAQFTYALVLGHYQKNLKNPQKIDQLIDAAYREKNVGAIYLKSIRLYYGYEMPRNVNAAAELAYEASTREDELETEWKNFNSEKFNKWESPETHMTVNLTDPGYSGHKRYQGMAAQGQKIRQNLEKTLKQNKSPIVRKQAEALSQSFDKAMGELSQIFGVAGKVAGGTYKFQSMIGQTKKENTTLDTEIEIRAEDAKSLTARIGEVNDKFSPDVQKRINALRARFDGLASRSFLLGGSLLSGPMFSEDTIYAMKTASRMRTDGCQFVDALDGFSKRTKVELTNDQLNEAGKIEADDIEKALKADQAN